MSELARWTYENTATILPFLGLSEYYQEPMYGEPYEIACRFSALDEQIRGNDGAEVLGRYTVRTEDDRPKFMDRIIKLGHMDVNEEIRSWRIQDRKMFDDTYDYVLITSSK